VIDKLISDYYPNEIGRFIYDSEQQYINREFEFIKDFEYKCIEQFNICTSLYESLSNWQKDEVIKYWVKQQDSYFEDEMMFSSKNLKKFDVVAFYNVTPGDLNYDELIKNDPYPTFYLNYYILKFRKLLINFFLFEEQCNLEALQISNYVKPEFNPGEFLNLPEINLPIELQDENIQSNITQKTIVYFFQLLRDSELKPKGSYSNNEYCRILCEEFNFTYAVKLAKHFSNPDLSEELPKVRNSILPNVNEDIRSRIEEYIQNNCT
jgi:hypothetical protein